MIISIHINLIISYDLKFCELTFSPFRNLIGFSYIHDISRIIFWSVQRLGLPDYFSYHIRIFVAKDLQIVKGTEFGFVMDIFKPFWIKTEIFRQILCSTQNIKIKAYQTTSS